MARMQSGRHLENKRPDAFASGLQHQFRSLRCGTDRQPPCSGACRLTCGSHSDGTAPCSTCDSDSHRCSTSLPISCAGRDAGRPTSTSTISRPSGGSPCNCQTGSRPAGWPVQGRWQTAVRLPPAPVLLFCRSSQSSFFKSVEAATHRLIRPADIWSAQRDHSAVAAELTQH